MRGFVIVLLLFYAASAVLGQPAPYNLRIEYVGGRVLGIDVQQPRFSWSLLHPSRNQAQDAYQIQVANNVNFAPVNMWDSGQVKSNQQTQVVYSGTNFTSDSSYYWRVRWWCSSSPTTASPWSDISQFDTGIFNAADWKSAAWIGSPSQSSNQFRTTFTLSSAPVRARLFIIGLGYYHLQINGLKVGDAVLGTFTTFEKRILYDVWDVTNMLSFQNSIAITLGNGWYSQSSVNVGPLSLLFRLSIQTADGNTAYVVSNTNGGWKTTAGPIVANDIYIGETYNSSMLTKGWEFYGYDDSSWSSVVTPNPVPQAQLTAEIMPKIEQVESFSPLSISQPVSNIYVFDFGQNMAGYCRLQVRGPPGTTITLIYSEMIYEDGTVQMLYGNAPQTDVFTLVGTGTMETFQTRFTYHGFQFVQVQGFPGTPSDQTLQAYFIHSALPETGQIVFSNPLLNAIQHMTRHASLSNFMNIPTDCPQRERRGWLGDAQLSAETTIHNWDMAASYTKFIRDIRDAQEFLYPQAKGAIPDCVPWYGHGGIPSDPAWGTAYTLLWNWMYQYYGDVRILTQYYDGVKMYIDSLYGQSDKNTGLLLVSTYGDWCSVAQYPSPNGGCQYVSPLVSSFYWITELEVFSNIAQLLGRTTDYIYYSGLATRARSAFHPYFYNNSTRSYAQGFQADNAIALYLGIVPNNLISVVGANLLNSLVNRRAYHLDTGIVGTKFLFPVLSDILMQSEVAYAISVQDTYPSYGWMVMNGATAMWETWQGTRYTDGLPGSSRNHIMFGSQSAWYYKSLAGIRNRAGGIGWDNIVIQPTIDGIEHNLTKVVASINTHRGIVASGWESVPAMCGAVPENSYITFQCVSGTIKNIDFASFGLPNGVCGNFSINPVCNAQDTVSIVSKLCLGQSKCSIFASDTVFGDPCFGTFKKMAVQVSGCVYNAYIQNATIPVNTRGNVTVPTLSSNANSVTVSESGTIVWSNGKFVPGAPGVSGAVTNNFGIAFSVGSGTYSFTLAGGSSSADGENVKRNRMCGSAKVGEKLKFVCPHGQKITRVEFANFGTGHGAQCGVLEEDHCRLGSSKFIVERECKGNNSCVVEVNSDLFGSDVESLCPGPKRLDAGIICA